MKTFKKILIIALIIFVLLFILAVIAGYILIKTFDIDSYKPQIQSAAKAATGHDIDFEDIDLAVPLNDGV